VRERARRAERVAGDWASRARDSRCRPRSRDADPGGRERSHSRRLQPRSGEQSRRRRECSRPTGAHESRPARTSARSWRVRR